MSHDQHSRDGARHEPSETLPPITRRGLLTGMGAAALAATTGLDGGTPVSQPAERSTLPVGKPLRLQPVLVYSLPKRKEKTSWRAYGGLQSEADVQAEVQRIDKEISELGRRTEFPLEAKPLAKVNSPAQAEAVAAGDADALLIFAASGDQGWLERLAACGKPNVWFLRQRSGPFSLWYEIVHWRFLRKNEDTIKEPHLTLEDVVVDDWDEVLWRLRALYGLKNARGTVMAAMGGLQAYSGPGGEHGPEHARKVWGYELKEVPDAVMVERLRKATADPSLMRLMERRADELLAEPGVTLHTQRRFVVNSLVATHVFKEIMGELGASNLGVAHCMGGLISVLDTPPCLVLSLLNDEGYTAFCHADLTHTVPGVLLRWISGKPSFVCNTHLPHHGMITLAHCAAPRRMDGVHNEPTKILTHFESDYGAATKVEYPRGQATTTIIPNLACTAWFGFRGRILGSPAYEACRSQMDVAIEGDWQRLTHEMQGFHAVTCYGDYLREVGYVLRKVGLKWENVSSRNRDAV